MNFSAERRKTARPGDFGYSEFHPRIWHGMNFGAWMDLTKRGITDAAKLKIHLVVSITIASLLNSLISSVYRNLKTESDQSNFKQEPIFILGFWRSGTTWLHELLAQDERHCVATGFQCFMPDNFVPLDFLAPVFDWMLPNSRPGDAVEIAMGAPQEDEFAIMNMGLESPYRYLAFPSKGVGPKNANEFWPQTKARTDRWLNRWLGFLRAVQSLNPNRRLVLKSPPHTARIEMILRAFPSAKFVHLGRKPAALFASSMKMVRAMLATQTLERNIPSDDDLAKTVFTLHESIYGAYFSQYGAIPRANLCVVRFEDLISDPESTLRMIYDYLDLGDIDHVLPDLRNLIRSRKNHKVDRYKLINPTSTEYIHNNWKNYSRYFGYK